MKIVALCLVGILLIVITTSQANSIITNGGLFRNSEAQLADNNSNNAAADVSLVSQRAYSDASLFHIAGEVQITGTEAAEFVQIVASFL